MMWKLVSKGLESLGYPMHGETRKILQSLFLPRDAMQARSMLSRSVCLSVRLSVRPSVCPSVRLSRSWITSKRINASSKFFSPSGSDTILVFPCQRGCQYSDGNPLTGRRMQGGMIKCRFFSQISRCISETVILRWAHAARQFVSIEFTFHPYNI